MKTKASVETESVGTIVETNVQGPGSDTLWAKARRTQGSALHLGAFPRTRPVHSPGVLSPFPEPQIPSERSKLKSKSQSSLAKVPKPKFQS